MGMLEKMVSGGGRILDIIKLIIEYDIPTASGIVLQARIEMTTEGSDSNLIIILEDRVLSSELSNVPKDFESITVNNNDDDDVKKPQSKKHKRNKYYYTKNITHDFQSNIVSNKKMDIIKYI